LAGAAGVVNLGLVLLALFVARPIFPALVIPLARLAGTGLGQADAQFALMMFVVIGLTVDRRLAKAIRHPVGPNVQAAVKFMLWSVVMADATLIHFKTGEPVYSLVTAALLIPAVFLGRWIFVT
jgi:hypothetical protein